MVNYPGAANCAHTKGRMPSFKVIDQLGVDIDVEPNPDSGLAMYARELTRFRLPEVNWERIAHLPLEDAPVNTGGAGISFDQPVPIGSAGELTIGAGVSGRLRLFRSVDVALFASGLSGDTVPIGPEEAYLAISITASVSGGASNSAGRLGFGVDAGREVTITNYLPFATGTPFADAFRESVAGFVFPATAEDLKRIPGRGIVTVEGQGQLRFSGDADLLTLSNPLATLSLPAPAGDVRVVAGGSVTIGASYTLSSEHQVRLYRTAAGSIQIGYYRCGSGEFSIRASARAGAGVLVRNYDPLAMVLRAISADAAADEDALERAGASGSDIDSIRNAVEAAIDRKLELAASFELGALSQRDAAFLYEVDLGTLDSAGFEMVERALQCNLPPLTEAGELLPPGIRMVRSVLGTLRRHQQTLKVNLLGIYNFVSISQLALSGSVLYEPATGDLVITDTATAQRVRASAVNFGADTQKLRNVLAESFLITAVYRSGKITRPLPELRVKQTYFELHNATNHQTMKDNLDIAWALGLISTSQQQNALEGTEDFGRSTVYAEASYGESETAALFMKQDGEARKVQEYEAAGRRAIAMLIQPGDPNEYRRIPATDDEIWKRMKSAGQPGFRQIFPSCSQVQVETLIADYSLIVWWSRSMADLAAALHQIRSKGLDVETARKTLTRRLKSVAAHTQPQFGDPWGLIAMDQAAGQRAEVACQITNSRLAWRGERKEKAVTA
ncbi:MAG: hypothetical protein KJZ78_09415 [Bryobacteraceae bacterium]|nr:hypothetical protein [Bryobacteraceae bacterium]